jgi:hypothetical protein
VLEVRCEMGLEEDLKLSLEWKCIYKESKMEDLTRWSSLWNS